MGLVGVGCFGWGGRVVCVAWVAGLLWAAAGGVRFASGEACGVVSCFVLRVIAVGGLVGGGTFFCVFEGFSYIGYYG